MNERAAKRMAAELRMLQREPPPGVSAWPLGDNMGLLEAVIEGPSETVYEGGSFKLSILIPERYPLEPPKVQFLTPIHHPNIDTSGRICLDILNMPPKGAYRPALNLSTILQSIGQLMRYPNPDDGLMVEITHEYKHNRPAFDAKARMITQRHATGAPEERRGVEATAAEALPTGSTAQQASAHTMTPADAPDAAAGSSGSVIAPQQHETGAAGPTDGVQHGGGGQVQASSSSGAGSSGAQQENLPPGKQHAGWIERLETPAQREQQLGGGGQAAAVQAVSGPWEGTGQGPPKPAAGHQGGFAADDDASPAPKPKRSRLMLRQQQ